MSGSLYEQLHKEYMQLLFDLREECTDKHDDLFSGIGAAVCLGAALAPDGCPLPGAYPCAEMADPTPDPASGGLQPYAAASDRGGCVVENHPLDHAPAFFSDFPVSHKVRRHQDDIYDPLRIDLYRADCDPQTTAPAGPLRPHQRPTQDTAQRHWRVSYLV